MASRAPPPKGIAGTIAVTVRLDPERYERLKMHGARRRRTNQQIIVAALDAYLAQSADDGASWQAAAYQMTTGEPWNYQGKKRAYVRGSMPRVTPFHSVDEARKPPALRVYHNHDGCPLGRAIPTGARVEGNGGHRLCLECERLSRREGNPWL
jgi:hypothetical protein